LPEAVRPRKLLFHSARSRRVRFDLPALCVVISPLSRFYRIAKMVSQQKKERKKKKEKTSEPSLSSSDIIASRKNLSNVRVIQRNLVYVTNLALSVAKEEVCCQTKKATGC